VGLDQRYNGSLRAGLPGNRIPVGSTFSHQSRPKLEAIQPPIQWEPEPYRG